MYVCRGRSEAVECVGRAFPPDGMHLLARMSLDARICTCLTEDLTVSVWEGEGGRERVDLCADLNLPVPLLVRTPFALSLRSAASGEALRLEDVYRMYTARLASLIQQVDNRTVTRLTDEGGEEEGEERVTPTPAKKTRKAKRKATRREEDDEEEEDEET